MTSRNSNVELLRLLCIVMIVSMHVFGRYNDNLSVWGWAALSVNNAVGNLGVTIFMLISGWYGIRLRTEKLLNLWNITLFWSLALIAVDVDHSAKNLVRSVFPVFTGKYWFLTVYIVISCLSPYVERLIAQLSRRQFQQLIAVLLLFFVVAPTFVILEIMHDSGKGVMNMLTVYLIGRYMARYGLPTRLKGICGGGTLLLILLFVAAVGFGVSCLAGTTYQPLARDNSIFMLSGAVIAFCTVVQLKPRTVGWINRLATYVFPIYIIHLSLFEGYTYIPQSLHCVLWLMVWLNAVALSAVSAGLEWSRRRLLSGLFAWVQRKELTVITKLNILR